MLYCVYKTTNLINEKEYIGFHKFKESVDDGYMGSGKLIKRALNLYGTDSFDKEVIAIFHDIEDAKEYERLLVDKKYFSRKDTYNLSIGGDVCILYGESNGFYGKSHSIESIKKAKESREKTITERGYSQKNKYHCMVDNTELYCLLDIKKYINKWTLYSVVRHLFSGEFSVSFFDKDFENEIKELYNKIKKEDESYKKILAKACSDRFLGVKKTKEHRDKIGDGHRGTKKDWVANGINKDPQKIEKTRQKHIGSKRSESAKENMKLAQRKIYDDGFINPIKGKCGYHNPKNKKEFGFFFEDSYPDNWIKGNPKAKKKNYYDPDTLICKRFEENEQPIGWIRGLPRK
jgi:hypothetical protein